MGQAPKCRAECRDNQDCPEGHACVTDKQVGYPACTKTCGSRVCGVHAGIKLIMNSIIYIVIK